MNLIDSTNTSIDTQATMPTEIPVISTAPQVPLINSRNATKNKNIFVLIIIVLVILIVGGCVAFYFNSLINSGKNGQVTFTPTTQTENQIFNGQYITGSVPAEWKLNEIISDNSIGDSVKGFNGIEVIHTVSGVSKKIFELSHLGGIGGLSTCNKIFKFADTSTQYIDSVIESNNTILSDPVPYSIVDLTQEKYLAVNLFGVDTRIVYSNPAVNDIYINRIIDGIQGFNPQCDELQYVVVFPKLSPTDDNNSQNYETSHNYEITYNSEGVSQDDVIALAGILNSLVQKSNTFKSDNFNYSFNYPQDWTVMETQGEPMDAPTNESGYMVSSNQNTFLNWNVGDKQSDGGEIGETIEIGDLFIPFVITKTDGNTVYSFSGSDEILGIDIPKTTRIEIVLTIKDGEDLETAKNVLKLMIGTLKITE
jgi:hypothetical protein